MQASGSRTPLEKWTRQLYAQGEPAYHHRFEAACEPPEECGDKWGPHRTGEHRPRTAVWAARGSFRNSVYLSGPCGFQIGSGVEAPGEDYDELISCDNPFPAALPEVADGEEDQLRGVLLGRERALGFRRFRSTWFSASTALVMWMIFRIASLKAKNGVTSAQARRRAGAMEGYFPAHFPSTASNWRASPRRAGPRRSEADQGPSGAAFNPSTTAIRMS